MLIASKQYDFCSKMVCNFIQGRQRHHTYFATLEDQVADGNPVRLIDAFTDKLDLQKLGFNKTVYHSEGRPPCAPQVLLKLYLYAKPVRKNVLYKYFRYKKNHCPGLPK